VSVGLAYCKCLPGYDGDGKHCTRNLCRALEDDAPLCGEHATCAPTGSTDASLTCGCEEKFGDCDANQVAAVLGCETDLATSPVHCGGCGRACAGTLTCSAGVCDQKVARLVASADTTWALMTPLWPASQGYGVQGWGRNTSGANDFRILGDPTFSAAYFAAPRALPELAVRDIASGDQHTCAVSGDKDSVICWGRGDFGQLGARPPIAAGVRVETVLPGVLRVAVGAAHTCALAMGKVSCWGHNASGELGSAAAFLTCALTNDSKVYCWPFGAKTAQAILLATDDSVLSDATQLSMGGSLHETQQTLACALRAGGEVVCWGQRSEAVPGLIAVDTAGKAAAVQTPANVIQIAAGYSHLCMLQSSGAVSCLGDHPANGALGFVSGVASVSQPTPVPGVTDAIELVAGGWHTCVRRASGQVQCWGRNGTGEVGDGTAILRSTPTDVMGMP